MAAGAAFLDPFEERPWRSRGSVSDMRLALPNAAFIGFTGTPLFKHDELTKRIFGDYVSR